MGVGIELLGKHVRCPHCKQVVLAPATPGGAPGGGPAAPPPQVAPQPVPAPAPQQAPSPALPHLPPMPEPMFNIMPKEAADSILSEPDESDDEVFGSQGFNRMPVPRLPDLNPGPSPYGSPPAYGPPPSPYGAPQPYAAPPPQPAPVHVPQPYAPAPAAAQNGNPFSFEPAAHAAPAPQPGVVPAPVHVPAPAASPQGLHATALDVNPFGGFDGPAPAPPPPPPQHVRPAVVPAPAPAPSAPAPSNPWAGVESQGAQPFQTAPAYPSPAPQPYPAPAHQQYPSPAPQPQPYPAPAASPFSAPASGSQHAARQDDDRDAAKAQPRPQRGKAAAAPASGGIPKAVVYGLAGYAALMTLLALYGLFFKGGDAPPGHPLESIPDTMGEFDPAQRKKVSLYKFKVDGPLPPNLVAQLPSGKVDVGGLEIEPVKVERRQLDMITVDKSGQKSPGGRSDSTLVLRLKIKNTSDVPFCPLDPAFSRKPSAPDAPATRLVLGTKEFTGGPIVWPSKSGARMYEKDQEKDSEPLKPGETREYSVCATTDAKLIPEIKKGGDKIVWRVQVRRTPVEYKGRSIPVTAVIGVEFSRADIQNF
ncbi:hypothetical protein [Gemmata sp.]|uniref:hypothetical protein n=1 Tax=Gemmata sp. TaxID=1914242 RepID=UPI003F6FE1F0